MIYHKKKSWFRKIFKRRSISLSSSFAVLKILFSSLLILCIILYLAYLMLLGKFFSQEKVEAFLNGYLAKNSKLTSQIDNLKITPNYKFDILIKADKIKINYDKNKNFITLTKPSIEIDLINLLFKKLDLNSIKTDDIIINTVFTKNKKYACLQYFNFDILNFQTKNLPFKLRNIKINSNNLTFNLFDENNNKNYTIKASKIGLSTSEIDKPALLGAKGTINSPDGKILDFNLNLEFLLKKAILEEIKNDILKLNHNPLKVADDTNFYSKADINLKTFKNNKTNLNGQIKLQDMFFEIGTIKLPKNNVVLTFKDNLIKTNCDFHITDKQFIKINLIADLANKKYLQTTLKSNDINLKELKRYIVTLIKIFNPNLNLINTDIEGVLNADIYLKSNFKTINSKGALTIKNAKISDKTTGLVLNNINSTINLENNGINIQNTSALIDNSKFYLNGTIDEKTNLNIKITSDLLDITKLINFASNLPLFKKYHNIFNNYIFKNGLAKFEGYIKGTLNKPFVEAKADIKNLKIYLKQQKIDLFMGEISLSSPDNNNNFELSAKDTIINYNNFLIKNENAKIKVIDNILSTQNTKVTFDNITSFVDLKINNLYSNTPEINLDIQADLPSKNKLIIIKNQMPKLKANVILKENNLIINNCEVFEKNKKLAQIKGLIKNINSNSILFDNLKLLIFEKISLVVPALNNITFEAEGEINISNTIKKPDINGDLKLYNIIYDKLDLFIDDLILNIKNSSFYVNIIKAKMLGFNFDLTAQAKYFDNTLTISSANFSSDYINLDKIKKLPKPNSKEAFNFEIQSLRGNIQTLETDGISLNSVYFDGSIKNNIMKINHFGADVFAGKIIGTLVIDLLNFKTKADVIAKELSVRHFSSKLKQLSIALSGRLSAYIGAEFIGLSFEDILKTFDGYVKFNIQDGELNQFARLERLLQAGNILSQSILKLTINSIASVITKQNTGDFKTIEGSMEIKNSLADVKYIKTQGTNMSLYLTGKFNLETLNCDLRILGKIPLSIVSVMGNIGKFSSEKIVDKLSSDTKDIIQSITVSPIEKLLSIELDKKDVEKIPSLTNQNEAPTREFVVDIKGNALDTRSIKFFRWHRKINQNN